MNGRQIITGKCHCGKIAYQAHGPVTRQGTCTCRACQRATGALESPNVGVDPARFEITSGTPSAYKADTDEMCDAGTFHFCSACGSQLYWQDAKKTEIAIFAGTLDNTELFVSEI